MTPQPHTKKNEAGASRGEAPGLRLTRLKKRADFVRAARGARAASPGLVLQCRPSAPANGTDTARIGFTATKKLGGAVTRNRVKRRLRAAADRVMPGRARAGYDYVLIGRSATACRPFGRLLEDLESALRRVHRQGPPRRRTRRREKAS